MNGSIEVRHGDSREVLKSYADADMTKNFWTADFAAEFGGGIVFLEGGPPHTPQWGAHPCCFAVGEVEGVALRPRIGMAPDVAEVISE